MRESLLLTALLMGLAGGPHCLLMCGPSCVGLAQMMKPRQAQSPLDTGLLPFHLGRMLGYASLGAVMGASLKGLGWLATHSAFFQPVWSLLHVGAAVLGLLIFIKAEQPTWLTDQAQALWRRFSGLGKHAPGRWGSRGLFVLGLVWTFLPCGLLYSALGVAALSSNALDGGLVMLAFALGSTLVLASGPWAWRKLTASRGGAGIGERTPTTASFWKLGLINTLQVQTWGLRLAGLSLAVLSTVSLWQALLNNQAPWCVTAAV